MHLFAGCFCNYFFFFLFQVTVYACLSALNKFRFVAVIFNWIWEGKRGLWCRLESGWLCVINIRTKQTDLLLDNDWSIYNKTHNIATVMMQNTILLSNTIYSLKTGFFFFNNLSYKYEIFCVYLYIYIHPPISLSVYIFNSINLRNHL